MTDIMVWIWLGVMALAVFVEMSTMALVSVWCAVGALVCVFAAYLGAWRRSTPIPTRSPPTPTAWWAWRAA